MLTEMKFDGLKNEILQRSARIAVHENDIRVAKKELEIIELRKQEIEDEILLFVSYEKEPGTEKSKYTNETTRKAEVRNRLKADSQYQSTLEEEKKISVYVLNKELELNIVQKNYDALKAVKDLYVTELEHKTDLHRDFDKE